jgi:hypothetical protein
MTHYSYQHIKSDKLSVLSYSFGILMVDIRYFKNELTNINN